MTRSSFTAILCFAAVVASSCGVSTAHGSTGDITGLIDVGNGRSLFVECRGAGSPTVILMAGKGNGAEDWLEVLAPGDPAHDAPGDDLLFGLGTLVRSDTAVLPSVGHFTRVCAYDRPDVRVDGTDVSTPRNQPHTVDQDVSDLRDLLAALGDPEPYVLVAHSYSGAVATLYARTYPDSIGGLVMVDAVSEVIEDVVSPAKLVDWDAGNATVSPQAREGVRVIDAFDQIRAAPPMPQVPVVVLSADKPWRTDLLPVEASQGEHVNFADWLAQQQRLAATLDVEPIDDTDSGHDIYLYSPALVTNAIAGVVAKVRGS